MTVLRPTVERSEPRKGDFAKSVRKFCFKGGREPIPHVDCAQINQTPNKSLVCERIQWLCLRQLYSSQAYPLFEVG